MGQDEDQMDEAQIGESFTEEESIQKAPFSWQIQGGEEGQEEGLRGERC